MIPESTGASAQINCFNWKVISDPAGGLHFCLDAKTKNEEGISELKASNKVMLVILDCSERKWKLIGEAIIYTQIFTDTIS
uniref:hypothetical protein n=1 Tax=uncultured Draconibacterium sp. TaxID=1573823 RepID=UPI0032164D1E